MKALMSTLFVIAAAANMAVAADKPDFSGTWKMDADKSVFGPIPPPTAMTRKIDHKDPTIAVDEARSGAQGDMNMTMKYSTDGKETVNQFMGNDVKATANWDGNALVVESTGFNDRSWLDGTGHPHTEALHLTERFRRSNVGHMDVELTIDDPKAYTKPWTVTIPMELMPDTEILEYVCAENEKDGSHMVGKASDPATPPKLTPELLDAYAGLYELHESSQVSKARITRTGSGLFFEAPGVNRHQLTPLATDAFAEVPDGRLEFVRDASGAVTGFSIQNPSRKISAIRLNNGR